MSPDESRLDSIGLFALLDPDVAPSRPPTTLNRVLRGILALESPVAVSPDEGRVNSRVILALLEPDVALARPATTLENLIVALEGPVPMGPDKCGLNGIVLPRK